MSLTFITGAPGSGKSAVTNEIASRGFAICDTDDPSRTGRAGWHNLETGNYVAGFNELQVTEDLLVTHIWKLTDTAIHEFRAMSQTEQVYLCGRLRDPQPLTAISNYLVFLTVEDGTIADRLTARAKIPGEVEWGKEKWQVERSIVVNRQIENEYRDLGAIMINAEQSVSAVVDDILKNTASI